VASKRKEQQLFHIHRPIVFYNGMLKINILVIVTISNKVYKDAVFSQSDKKTRRTQKKIFNNRSISKTIANVS
jgi:hypothetical protein